MNGLQLVPDEAKTQILVTPKSITSNGKVSVYAGDIRIHHDDLLLTLPDGTGKDKITPDRGFQAQIGDTAYGMALGSELQATFGRDGSTQIVGPLLLPAELLNNKGLEALKKDLPTVNMTLHTTLAKGLDKNAISASKDAIALGPVQLKNVSLAYEQISDTWTGSAKVGLPTPTHLLVGAGLSFQHGSFKSAYAEVDQPQPADDTGAVPAAHQARLRCEPVDADRRRRGVRWAARGG